MPAIAPPRTKVNTTTLLTSMPISAAASPSSATARIAVPIFVRCTIRYRQAHEEQREHDHQHIDARDVEAEDAECGALPGRGGIGFHRRTEHAAERLLQEERHADGADQRREADDAAEWPVGDALGQHGDGGRGYHRDDEDRGHAEHRMRIEKAGAVKRRRDEIAGERAGHHEVAVREIDQPQHAVDHGVAQRDLRVDAADGQAEHEEVEPLRGGVAV